MDLGGVCCRLLKAIQNGEIIKNKHVPGDSLRLFWDG